MFLEILGDLLVAKMLVRYGAGIAYLELISSLVNPFSVA
jgi:hypothetical protein